MDKFAVFHFNVNKNDRNYQFLLQPGAPFEDVFASLEEFKAEFVRMQQEFKENEEKAKAEAEKVPQEVEAEIIA